MRQPLSRTQLEALRYAARGQHGAVSNMTGRGFKERTIRRLARLGLLEDLSELKLRSFRRGDGRLVEVWEVSGRITERGRRLVAELEREEDDGR